MPEAHSMEDEAARYVLGELSPAERRRFEAQLEQSEALRAQVRQLEEGALALALTVRRRQPPKELWGQIERTLARETSTGPLWSVLRGRFWRNGWAVAGACLVGWGLSVWYLHRPEGLRHPAAPTVAVAAAPPTSPALEAHSPRPAQAPPLRPGLDQATAQVLKARAEEIGALRGQVADLSNRMAHLSRALTQQQEQLLGPGHFQFFQLTPGASEGAAPAPLAPSLQRALALALARELGWPGPVTPSPANGVGGPSEGIDFVYLRSDTNHTEHFTPAPAQPEAAPSSEPSYQASTSGGATAGFISGTNAVLAFDNSVVPSGTALSFWTTSASGHSHPVGSVTTGDNPMVVTVPMVANEGGGLMVFATSAGGQSNVLYSLPSANTPH